MKIMVDIKSDKKIMKKYNDLEDTLSNFRKKRLQEYNNCLFINKEGRVVAQDEENNLSINEIVINEKNEKEIKMIKYKTVKLIFINESKEFLFYDHEKVNEFREINKIDKNYIFTDHKADIEIGDEDQFEIEEIIQKVEEREEIHMKRIDNCPETEKRTETKNVIEK